MAEYVVNKNGDMMLILKEKEGGKCKRKNVRN